MKILAFGAHPDDIEFGCAGILIEEIKKGNEIHLFCGSKGEAGSAGTPELREKETQKAAAIIGAPFEWIDFGGDCHIENTRENAFKIAKIIRQHKPDIVLAPPLFENQHPDHQHLGRMVRDACRFARYGGLHTLKEFEPHRVDSLYYYSISILPPDSYPDIIYDISDAKDQWIECIEAHATQIQNKRYLDMHLSKSKYLGVIAGIEYGMGLWHEDPIIVNNLQNIKKTGRNM